MKVYNLYLKLTYFVFIFYSCTQGEKKDIESANVNKIDSTSKISLKWAEGSFEYSNATGIYKEAWKKINNTEYEGLGCFCIKTDTVFKMSMRLYKAENTIKMSYKVNHQNENKATDFILSKHLNNVYVFENPFRSFPSIMQYKFLGDTAIEVKESGFENNKAKVVEFTVTKSKQFF